MSDNIMKGRPFTLHGEVKRQVPDLRYKELIKQEYSGNRCIFSGGIVEGHDIDSVYIKLQKEKEQDIILLLTPDELAAISWCATGVLWSLLVDQRGEI